MDNKVEKIMKDFNKKLKAIRPEEVPPIKDNNLAKKKKDELLKKKADLNFDIRHLENNIEEYKDMLNNREITEIAYNELVSKKQEQLNKSKKSLEKILKDEDKQKKEEEKLEKDRNKKIEKNSNIIEKIDKEIVLPKGDVSFDEKYKVYINNLRDATIRELYTEKQNIDIEIQKTKMLLEQNKLALLEFKLEYEEKDGVRILKNGEEHKKLFEENNKCYEVIADLQNMQEKCDKYIEKLKQPRKGIDEAIKILKSQQTLSSKQERRENNPPSGREEDNLPPQGGEEKDPPPTGGEEKDPPPTGGEEKDPPPQGGEENDPPPPGGEGNNPPQGGEEKDPPPTGGEENDPPPGGEENDPPPGGEENDPPPPGGEENGRIDFTQENTRVKIVMGRNPSIQINENLAIEIFDMKSKDIKKGLNLSVEEKAKLIQKYIESENDQLFVVEMMKKKEFDISILNAIDKAPKTLPDAEKKRIAKQYLDQTMQPDSSNDISIEYDLDSLSKVSIFKRLFRTKGELNNQEKFDILSYAEAAEKRGIATKNGEYKVGRKEKLISFFTRKQPLYLPSEQDIEFAYKYNNDLYGKEEDKKDFKESLKVSKEEFEDKKDKREFARFANNQKNQKNQSNKTNKILKILGTDDGEER